MRTKGFDNKALMSFLLKKRADKTRRWRLV